FIPDAPAVKLRIRLPAPFGSGWPVVQREARSRPGIEFNCCHAPSPGSAPRLRTIAFTLFALVAFAANSVLCRLALGPGAIDAASFSSVRLVSGGITLLVITIVLKRGDL